MSEYVTLLGAEDVSRAGYAMRDAATQISNAASLIDDALQRHATEMRDMLEAHAERIEAATKEGTTCLT